jgi:uncharacterized NAD(P)/FAD-binding protein YdhS
MQKITVIGGGATGILLAANLLKYAEDQPLEINIIEKKSRFGVGVAYSTVSDFHLLNVPAGKMGAFSADAEHFHKWLKDNRFNYAATDFVPRKIYGEYLTDIFRHELENKSHTTTVNLFNDEAVAIDLTEKCVEIRLDSGKVLEADKVVLAFGNFLPSNPKVPNNSFTKAEKYTQNPWNGKFFDKLDKADEVLLIGTGLTMVDAVLSLYNREHKGKITAVSRHGLLPETHKLGFVYQSFECEILNENRILPMFKIVRKHIKLAEASGSNRHAVIDSLRPFTQTAWQQLPVKEKRRFMRHLCHFWTVVRSRIPNECAKVLETLKFSGKLEIKRGKIRNIAIADDRKFAVTYGEHTVLVDAIINCTGSNSNFEKLDIPLVKNLVREGFVRNDAVSIGLDALPTGEIIDKYGKINEKLYTIGTALKGVLWESTAMPEISLQAKDLALHLLQKAKGASIGK